MSCEISAGRATSCKDATGGIKGIYIHNYDEWYNSDETIIGTEETDQEISDISAYGTDGSTQTAFEVYYFALRREMANLSISVNSDPSTGTTFFEQVLTVDFIKLTLQDANTLRVLAYGRPQIIVEDNQGNLLMLGAKNGMDVTGGTIDTGQAFGDKNGMQITFTGRETTAFMELVGPVSECTAGTDCLPAPFDKYTATMISVDPEE